MGKNLSVAEILANLEARIAFHQERKAFHTEQEAHHRGQLALHDAELTQILQRFEAFKTAAEAAWGYAEPPAAPLAAEPQADEEEIAYFGNRPMVSRLIGRVVESQPEGEEFGARAVAEEVNRRYGSKLERRVDPGMVSVVLRRLRDSGRLQMVKPGKAVHGALYVRAAQE